MKFLIKDLNIKLRNHFIRSCKLKTMYKMIKNKYLFYQQSKYYADFEQQ